MKNKSSFTIIGKWLLFAGALFILDELLKKENSGQIGAIYKIPIVNDEQFEGMRLSDIRRYVHQFYRDHFEGKSVKNRDKEITIHFTEDGIRHVLYARKGGYQKYKAIVILDQLVKNAEYTQFNYPDKNDPKSVIGFLNFKSFAIIEGKKYMFKIVVQLRRDGKYFYDQIIYVPKKENL